MPSSKALLPLLWFKKLISASSCCLAAQKPLKQHLWLGSSWIALKCSPQMYCFGWFVVVSDFLWSFCFWLLFVFFFNQSWNWGWPWWFARLQDAGSTWVESFLSTVAVMTWACSSHIWMSSTALKSCAFCWLWELARGCGRGIVFPNTGALCCLCVMAYTCLCDPSQHTARKASVTWMAQGKVQFCHLVGKVVRAASCSPVVFSGSGSGESQQLQPA